MHSKLCSHYQINYNRKRYQWIWSVDLMVKIVCYRHGFPMIKKHIENSLLYCGIPAVDANVNNKKLSWHWKLTLKVRFMHFLTTRMKVSKNPIPKKYLSFTDFVAKIYSLLIHALVLRPQNSTIAVHWAHANRKYSFIFSSSKKNTHGWVISTVIERRQQQLGTMADFLPPVTFSVFYL